MMRHVAGLDEAIAHGLHPDLSTELVEQILEEAGKFAGDAISPFEPGRRCLRGRSSKRVS